MCRSYDYNYATLYFTIQLIDKIWAPLQWIAISGCLLKAFTLPVMLFEKSLKSIWSADELIDYTPELVTRGSKSWKPRKQINRKWDYKTIINDISGCNIIQYEYMAISGGNSVPWLLRGGKADIMWLFFGLLREDIMFFLQISSLH